MAVRTADSSGTLLVALSVEGKASAMDNKVVAQMADLMVELSAVLTVAQTVAGKVVLLVASLDN